MDQTCAKCGSDQVIPNVLVMDQGQYSSGTLSLHIEADPTAFLFKGGKSIPLRAHVCGGCGYTELYATKPGELVELYRSAQAALAREQAREGGS